MAPKKRSERNSSETTTAESPNPRDTKTAKQDQSIVTTHQNTHQTVERGLKQVNLLDKFLTADTAIINPGIVSGGRRLWGNLIAPSNDNWELIQADIRNDDVAYVVSDKHPNDDSPAGSLQELADLGCNASQAGQVPGK